MVARGSHGVFVNVQSGRYLVSVLFATLVAALVLAVPANANFELVKTFAEGQGPSGENRPEGLSGGPGGLAVDDQSGDLYEADGGNDRIMRFDSQGDFLEAWGWGAGDGKEEYERCGPDGEPAYPTCPGRNAKGESLPREGAGEFDGLTEVAIDQSTGDVYVETGGKQSGLFDVFSPTGELIGSFGEHGEETPEQIQSAEGPSSLAVDSSGDLYQIDGGEKRGSRVVEFKPESAGDYGHYVYAGEPFHGNFPASARELAVDAQGDIYLASEHAIYKFEAGKFVTPTWEFKAPSVASLSVDPSSGRAFYYARNKNEFHELNASGDESASFKSAQGLGSPVATAFNPNAVFIAGRAPGVVYVDLSFGVDHPTPPTGLIFAQAPVFPPSIDGESTSGVGSTSASLDASINPRGYETSYRFQYGSEDCSVHMCAEAPVGGADLGAGQEDLTAGATLSGLTPGTTYHYRVLASNQFGTVESLDQTFTTYPLSAVGLPDRRVYELVSPAFKDGGEVFVPFPAASTCGCGPGENALSMPEQSGPDGDSVVYTGFPFSASGGTANDNEYLSTRTATGWQTRDLSPPLEASGFGGYSAFSSDLTIGVLTQSTPALAPEAPSCYRDLYVHESEAPVDEQSPLLTASPPNRSCSETGSASFDMDFAGASSDFSHIVFEANDVLTGATAFAPVPEDGGPSNSAVGLTHNNLYEWTAGGLRLVNVLPGNTVSHAWAVLGAGTDLATTTESGPDYSHAISADGKRIFWTDEASRRLYVRETGETTVEIPDRGEFLTATPDGAAVLLNDGHIYDLETKALVDLTGGHGGFQGILGSSEDLSRVYFVDTEVLSGREQNAQGASAQAGKDNAYAYEAASGTSRFITTLSPQDNGTGVGGESGSILGVWVAAPSNRLAQVTSDGRLLAFMSRLPLTGYNNIDALTGRRDFEVYEYDSTDGTLSCASCSPTGTPPVGESRLGLMKPLESTFPQPYDLSNDGRVVFDSSSRISPYDVNGRVQDVYEYEPQDVDSCTRTGGCISLISSGSGTGDSEFVDADPNGENVFFTTREHLVPEDQDDLIDLYDARIDGGFPAITQPACTGTGCQGVPNAPPIFATPSSVTFNGVGNLPAPTVKATVKKKAKCAKGKTFAHGKCVKAKRKTKKAARSKAKRSKRSQRGGVINKGSRS